MSVRKGTGAMPVYLESANSDVVIGKAVVTTAGGIDIVASQESGAMIVLDHATGEIHAGRAFSMSYVIPTDSPLANDGNLDVVISVGEHDLHILSGATFGGDCEVLLYEDVNFDADGVELVVYNKDRMSGEVSTASAVRDPTINAVGTLLDAMFVPGNNGWALAGIPQSHVTEWILARNKDYLYRLTNRCGNARCGGVVMIWSERAPV